MGQSSAVPEMLPSLQGVAPESNFSERAAQSRPPILVSHMTNVHTSAEEKTRKICYKMFIRAMEM
jgi:hypothetical protein